MGYVGYSMPRERQGRSPLPTVIASASSTRSSRNSIVLSNPNRPPLPNKIVASSHHLNGPLLPISAIWEPLAFALLYLGLHTATTPLIHSFMTLIPPPPPSPLAYLAFKTHDRQGRPLPPDVLLSKEDLLNVVAMAVSKCSEGTDWRASRWGFCNRKGKRGGCDSPETNTGNVGGCIVNGLTTNFTSVTIAYGLDSAEFVNYALFNDSINPQNQCIR